MQFSRLSTNLRKVARNVKFSSIACYHSWVLRNVVDVARKLRYTHEIEEKK